MNTAKKLQQLEKQLIKYYKISKKHPQDDKVQTRATQVKQVLRILRKHHRDISTPNTSTPPPTSQPLVGQNSIPNTSTPPPTSQPPVGQNSMPNTSTPPPTSQPPVGQSSMPNTSTPPSTSQPLGSQIKQDPQELAAAEQLIDAYYAKTNGTETDKFVEISNKQFVDALKERVKDPDGVNQAGLNLCGAASFMIMWIERDPKSFVQATIELFQKGKAKYKDIELEANKRMFKLKNQKSNKQGKLQYALQLIDWLVLSSLQNAKGLLGYSPDSEWGGLRGIGLPGDVLEWFKSLSDGEAKKYHQDLEVGTLNKLYASDHYIIFLVNIGRLDNYFTTGARPDDTLWKKIQTFFGGITGDHYVVLNSSIKTNANQELEFNILSWSDDIELVMPLKEFERCVKQTFVVEPEKN